MPAEWALTEENRTQPIRGAALPMGFNRTPHYTDGLLLAGDAAGLVNPFNGEGIAYAMESGEIVARVVVQALAEAGHPFSILTKSTLILRDLDLLADAAGRTDVGVNLSIGTLDEEV